jgi:hypothetical protein
VNVAEKLRKALMRRQLARILRRHADEMAYRMLRPVGPLRPDETVHVVLRVGPWDAMAFQWDTQRQRWERADG